MSFLWLLNELYVSKVKHYPRKVGPCSHSPRIEMYTDYMSQRAKIGFIGEEGKRSLKKATNVVHFGGVEYLLLSNSGLQGGILFSSQEDYDRFEAYLYLLNAIEGPRASNFFLDGRGRDIFSASRGGQLVAIGAYSITPKKFFILVRQLAPNGIAKFMQKLQTAYTMYFNIKYQRSGRIFHSGYRSEVAQTEKDLKYFFSYTHLHPAVIFDTHWDESNEMEMRALAYKAAEYRYSSIGEYVRKEFAILSPESFPKFVYRAKNADALLRMWREGKTGGKSSSEK